MLVDTDVLVWHLRGFPQATRRLDELGLELLQGIRNQSELLALRKMFERRSATLIPITESITKRAIELMESLTLSHGLQMGDALIRATALEQELPVLTANARHFSTISGHTGLPLRLLSIGSRFVT